jgi:RimJ/RimL family protein N-acetyltransferase
MRYAFDDLDLHLVELWTLACNERAIRAYQACGFTTEGVRRRRSFKDGSWARPADHEHRTGRVPRPSGLTPVSAEPPLQG